MNRIETQLGDESPPVPKPTALFASQELANQHQISALLTILAQTSNVAYLEADENDPDKGAHDGGLRMAAMITGIKACDRLDAILSDDKRWTLSQSSRVEESVIEANSDQSRMFRERANTLLAMRRPSARFRPAVIRLENFFVAYTGDLQTPGAAIVGRGDTPENALKDYDAAFERTPEQQLKVALDYIHPIVAEQTEVPPPSKPKRKKK